MITDNKEKDNNNPIYAVILAGGIGSRFWPLSRATTPKQLLSVVGDESLLQATIKRLSPLIPPEKVFVVTNEEQAELIRLHLSYEGESLSPGYIVEPMGRNTAPAIGLAALRLFEKNPEAVMAVLPADHIIRDNGAESYLREGGYYWNSGIFLWKVNRILDEIKLHLPQTFERLMDIRDGADMSGAYEGMEPISIDNGILEKADDVAVIPADFNWSDMGSWNSFGEILDPDKDGNVVKGRVVNLGSSNSVIFGCNRVVAAIGLKDMILVDTPDATLVCPKERAQDVKAVVEILKEKGYTEHAVHRTTKRPWGSYTVLEKGPGYKIKKIVVKPGQRLSLQLHHRRSEHWVVIQGRARVSRGEDVRIVSVNESLDIPVGVKHRLDNPGETPLEIIEVQNGSYLEEDDIVRFDDDFQRETR